MKLKKGMKVRILSKEELLKRYLPIDHARDTFRAKGYSIHLRGDMVERAGKIVTLDTDVDNHYAGKEKCFRIKEDRGRRNWSFNMIEPPKEDCNDLVFNVLKG